MPQDPSKRMPPDRSTPFAWWGPPEWGAPEPMSIPQLIHAGDLDAPTAAILWALMARRASLIVAAMPRLAGKTTLLTAMADFLPKDAQRIYLRGSFEQFDFLPEAAPARGYLLVNELSDHLPYYLWEEGARRALDLLPQGYGLGATMHAESPQHAIQQLSEDLGAGRKALDCLTAVVNLEMRRDWRNPTSEPLRRVQAITLLQPGGNALAYLPILRWDPAADRFLPATNAVEALASRLGARPAALRRELAAREAHIAASLRDGHASMDAFRTAVLSFQVSPLI